MGRDEATASVSRPLVSPEQLVSPQHTSNAAVAGAWQVDSDRSLVIHLSILTDLLVVDGLILRECSRLQSRGLADTITTACK